MSKVQGVGYSAFQPTVQGTAPKAAPGKPTAPQDIQDSVQISEVARLAAKVFELPEVRTELVERVKAEIEAGTFETPERIDATVDRILEDLLPRS